MRGTAPWRAWADAGHRITPACAGNRCRLHHECDQYWDHPRVCGEQTLYGEISDTSWGSPPRVRGTVVYLRIIAHLRRITPACAGNSLMLVERMSSE